MMEGRIGPGNGIAAARIAAMPDPAGTLGYTPYPGTLNVRLRRRMTLPTAAATVVWDRWTASFHPVRVGNVAGHVVRWSPTNEPVSSVEIVAPVRLRDALGLPERGTVQIDGLRTPIRGRAA